MADCMADCIADCVALSVVYCEFDCVAVFYETDNSMTQHNILEMDLSDRSIFIQAYHQINVFSTGRG